MAGIKSLAVRGIRSFGPDEADEQRISFEKPLTLILGQNGCGKTTIIECLRYAITGQMPPGSRNECFVHDAKVNRSTEVMGQVKLKIVNPKDKQLEISRSMRVTALKSKTKFQTLDSFLSVIDENGKTKDISSRCADLDFVMHEELGVSKAILNSVIFCHQEDSSWPLDEGKKVKERFDEIFDADKYSDCFDRLRKLRKTYTTTLQLLEQEVAHLTDKKEELDKKKLDVVTTESRISEEEIKVSELAAELKPINEKLHAIETLQKNLVAFESKKEKIKTKLEHNQTQEQELKKIIKTEFEGTTPELQDKISNYGATEKAKQKELQESYKKNMSFNKDEEKIANEKTANEVKFNKLILLESQNQERIDNKYKMIIETAKLCELEEPIVTNTEEAEKACKDITDKLKALKKVLDEVKAEAEAEENKQQAVVNDSREALAGHKQKITSKQAEIKGIKSEIDKTEKDINLANKSKDRLEVVEGKLKESEEEYEQAVKELNTEECQKEINDDEKSIETQEVELEELNTKVTKLQKQTAKIKERDMIEETLNQKEKQLSVLKNKHKSSLQDLLGEIPESNFALSVNKVDCDIKSEVDNIKRKLKKIQTELTKHETERKHAWDSLNKNRNELTKAEDKMYKACGSQTYEASLAKYTASVEKLQEEKNFLQSSIMIFAKYKKQLKEDSCCPLCSRAFDAENDVTDLIAQLTNQVMNVPSNLEKVTEELQRSSEKKDELISMKSLNEKIATLKETEIPQLESKLAVIDKETATMSEQVEELSMSVIEPEQKLQTVKLMQGEMTLMDKYTTEIRTTTKEFEKLKEQCSDVDTTMTLDEATAKQKDLRQTIANLRSRVKASQKKLNTHTKRVQSLADKKNKMKEELLLIQKKIQEIVNLQENLKQQEVKRDTMLSEVKELQNGISPLEQVLKENEGIKGEIVKKNKDAIEAKRSHNNGLINAFDKVKAVEAEIKQHEARNTQKEMDKIKEANETLMEKQKQIMIDRDTLTKKIDSLKDELAKQEIYKRDLEDNLKLRKAQTEIANCEKEMADITEKLKEVNVDMLGEKEPLIKRQTELFKQKAQTEGGLNELKKSLKVSKAELKKAMSKDVERRFKEKLYELHVTKAIDKDIRDYSVALEKCLMEFHKEKMENINLIIREMWRKIYRGNDIDYIEIKTEGSMTTESDRRKYDYRVVQCKNGVEIDMRGRCSAGQKVLACLIIRLALAETFSSRFGILALDEPTTNLDEENVKSLCGALGEIVQERMNQKNFMFIIITHDREFIESLGNIDKVTHFYEVSRNDDGKSRVKKIRFS